MPPSRDFDTRVPAAWQPLVSEREWTTIGALLGADVAALRDLRVRLEFLAPGDRRLLLDNLARTATEDAGKGPQQILFFAFVITFDHVIRRSAEQIAREQDRGRDDSPASVVDLPARREA